MARLLKEPALCFDDIVIAPQYSDIGSRLNGEINTGVKISISGCTELELSNPIVSSNMDSVTGPETCNAINVLGGLGIMHRFMSVEDTIAAFRTINGPKILSVGVGEEAKTRCKRVFDVLGCGFLDGICIDVAHGHHKAVLDMIKWLGYIIKGQIIIAGNIATVQGARDLMEAGAHIIKIGCGPGSLCSTRVITGCGYPQLGAIMAISEALDGRALTIADGGIRSSGDLVKSLAAGADFVMLGGLLAGHEESPGDIIQLNGKKFKRFRGMASKSAQEDWKGAVHVVEGEEMLVPYRGPIRETVDSLLRGLRSGMSYVGARNLAELREKAVFVVQTHAGIVEGKPHGKT